MVAKGNIRMLSVYYSTQKFFKNDLAAPLVSAIRPVINVQEHSYSLLVEKALPNMKGRINSKKLQDWLKRNFYRIDSGKIKPTKFIGHTLKTDEIVENAKKHDTYTALYKAFFKELSILRYECSSKVGDDIIYEIMRYHDGLDEQEKSMLKHTFSDFYQRPPITLDMDMLKELVDIMHGSAEKSCGSSIADLALSNAAIAAKNTAPSYDVYKFL